MRYLRELAQRSRNATSSASHARVVLPARFAPPPPAAPGTEDLGSDAVFASEMQSVSQPVQAALAREAHAAPNAPPLREDARRLPHAVAPPWVNTPDHERTRATLAVVSRSPVGLGDSSAKAIVNQRAAAFHAGSQVDEVLTARGWRSAARQPTHPPGKDQAIAADALSSHVAAVERGSHTGILAPLSAQTVTSRVPVREGEQPIIHVTIDRIEVRAPQATTPVRTPRARPAAAPNVSLSDYLRRGKRGGGSA